VTVPFVRQSPSMCGPASLRAVLLHHGVDASEDELRKRSGATSAAGTRTTGLVDAARSYGLRATLVREASYERLREALRRGPAIVRWFSENDGHYSVVVAALRDSVLMMDPERGYRRMPRAEFERVWFDFSQTAPRGRLLRRQLVEVSPPAAARPAHAARGRVR